MLGLTGYPREGRRWGVRNHVLVLPAQAAANLAARRIAEAAGAISVAHEWEAELGGPDFPRVERTLAGFAANGNVASVLVVGVTSEDLWLAQSISRRAQTVEFIALAEYGGTAGTVAAGTKIVAQMVRAAARAVRQPMSESQLVLGLECGGSDAFSGITANPALGIASDLLVGAGGTSILAEIPELIGAEHLLAARAVNPQVARQVLEVIGRFETAIRQLGVDVRGAQPAPGNIEGGLTTIEEKSLGAAKKGGSAPIAGCLEYAECATAVGLLIMDTPGHDIEQMVGMVAGGAQVVAFTTGRGTPTGSAIAPCIKIATNSAIFRRMAGDIDLDAGAILPGDQTIESMGRLIYEEVIAVAGGKVTSSELHGNREFAISRVGATVEALLQDR